MIAATGALVLLLFPVFGRTVGTFGTSEQWFDCGVPLRALLQVPGYGCFEEAVGRVHAAMPLAGVAVAMFALGGVKSWMRFLGFVFLAGAPFVVLTKTTYDYSTINYYRVHGYSCGSVVAELARRGHREVETRYETLLVDPRCGDLALRRLAVSLAAVCLGVALIVLADGWRRRRYAAESDRVSGL